MTRPAHRNPPPMRDGVSASCIALPAGSSAKVWPLMLDFLAQRLPGVTRDEWLARLHHGKVLNEHGQAVAADAPYRAHQRLYYYRELASEPRIPFDETVLFQDEHLVVADKPHFLPVTPSGRYVQESLLVRLKRKLGIESLSPIHRIDRETAGLVLFSLRAQDRGAYQALFREQTVRKIYHAIAPWRSDLALPTLRASRIVPDQQFFRQREVPGEPNSRTQIALLETQGTLARYALRPLSGKTHQLRVHMHALGLPIVGDLFYPQVVHGPGGAPDDYAHPLQLLAKTIGFVDPITGQQRQFESARDLTAF